MKGAPAPVRLYAGRDKELCISLQFSRVTSNKCLNSL